MLTLMKVVAATAALLAISACGTPKSVLETATTTAANVSLVNSSLEALKTHSMQSAERRREYIMMVSDSASEMRSEARRLITAKEIVEDKNDQKTGKTVSVLVAALIAELDAIRVREREEKERSEKTAAAVAASYASLTVPSEQMKSLAKALSDLGQEQSRADQLKFLRGFFKESYDTYKKAQDAAAVASSDSDAAAKSAAASPKTLSD